MTIILILIGSGKTAQSEQSSNFDLHVHCKDTKRKITIQALEYNLNDHFPNQSYMLFKFQKCTQVNGDEVF